MEGGAPHPVEGAQVEGGGQHGPLGRHVGEATQQEPTCPLLFLDDSEGRARLADGSRGPVQMQRNSIRMLDAKELEPPSLWTRKPESTEGVALQQRKGRRVAKGGDGSGRIQGRWVRWRPFGSRVETLWPFADVGRERTQQETLPDRGWREFAGPLGSLVDGSDAMGAVKMAVAGPATERGRD